MADDNTNNAGTTSPVTPSAVQPTMSTSFIASTTPKQAPCCGGDCETESVSESCNSAQTDADTTSTEQDTTQAEDQTASVLDVLAERRKARGYDRYARKANMNVVRKKIVKMQDTQLEALRKNGFTDDTRLISADVQATDIERDFTCEDMKMFLLEIGGVAACVYKHECDYIGRIFSRGFLQSASLMSSVTRDMDDDDNVVNLAKLWDKKGGYGQDRYFVCVGYQIDIHGVWRMRHWLVDALNRRIIDPNSSEALAYYGFVLDDTEVRDLFATTTREVEND